VVYAGKILTENNAEFPVFTGIERFRRLTLIVISNSVLIISCGLDPKRYLERQRFGGKYLFN
jgi:hypothetical protein